MQIRPICRLCAHQDNLAEVKNFVNSLFPRGKACAQSAMKARGVTSRFPSVENSFPGTTGRLKPELRTKLITGRCGCFRGAAPPPRDDARAGARLRESACTTPLPDA